MLYPEGNFLLKRKENKDDKKKMKKKNLFKILICVVCL